MSDSDLLEEAKEAFRLATEAEAENRAEALDDYRFARLAEQWPEEVRRQRALEGRPCLTINAMPSFIRQVVNDGRQNKPSVSIHPADDQADPDTAQVFAGLIRNIEYASRAQAAYDTALECAVTGGLGYWRVNTAYTSEDSFDQDIVIERVANPFSIYGDPHGTEVDSSDWNSAFAVELMDRKRFGRTFKNRDAVDWSAAGYDRLDGDWRDGERILVAQYWKREAIKRPILLLSTGEVVGEAEFRRAWEAGEVPPEVTVIGQPRETRSHKVTHCRLSGAEVLESPETWPGRFIPIVPVFGDEVNVEGRRHLRSLVRDAKDPQRNYNYWRTAATELVALAPKSPFIGAKGSFDTDADKWATANTESHAFIEYDPVPGGAPPQRQAFAGVPAGALQEALNANDDMKRVTGLHDASLGIRSNETSGVAIRARQREGDVSTFHFIDNLSRSIAHTGRILIDLIPRVYSQERIVRVLGGQGTREARTVRVGPQEAADALERKKALASAEEAERMGRIYVLGAGKYDLTVEAGPGYTTLREEAGAQMLELLRARPELANVIGDLFAESQDWPMADKIAERMRALLPPELRGEAKPAVPPQVEAMVQQGRQVIQQQQGQLQQLAAALRTAQAGAAEKQAELALKARELDIKQLEAEAKLLEARTRARTPVFPGGPPREAFAG